MVVKTVSWRWVTDTQINETGWNPETAPHKYSQLIFDKDPKAVQWRKDSHFNNKWC